MMDLVEWKESGIQLLKALRTRGEEAAFRRLLSDLYPDQAHFIYELFQNSEDSEADLCRFTLSREMLEFDHNGKKIFTCDNVIAITSFGNSTKRNDPTSIGKFGVGFKAVFAYTNTPEIHSGEFHFRIDDLVVPETDGVPKLTMGDRETRFIFPFDHPTKRAETAVDEVESTLRALGDNTLLFLSHIRTIEYALPDGSLGYLERIEHPGGLIEIKASHPGGKDTVSHWLRFQKRVEVIDEDGKLKPCQIAIAYRIEQDADNKKRRGGWKVVPLEPGEVSIYFPAKKETSNLRFHMHAPFASTVARDSVRDCEANDQLRDYIAELVVESLSSIRDQGMLTMRFLAVLPNPEDGLSDFYEPIRQAVVNAFTDQPFTPTRSGSHAPATRLYRGPVKIAEVLEDEGLSLVLDCPPEIKAWAANPPQRNQREDRFLESLSMDNWGWAELASGLSLREDEDERKAIEEWIAEQNDDWVIRFYALLGEAHDQPGVSLELSEDYQIIRVEAEDGHKHVSASQAFLPPDEGAMVPINVCILKNSLLSRSQSSASRLYVERFLERIGVKPYDNKAIVKLTLDGYRDRTKPSSPEGHIADVKGFIGYWQENKSDAEIFSDIDFLYCDVPSSSERFEVLKTPSSIYMDDPYCSAGLRDLFENHHSWVSRPKYRISDRYKELNGFVDFSKSVGVMLQLEIAKYHATEMQPEYFSKTGKSTKNTRDEDYYINGLYWRRKSSVWYIGSLNLDEFVNISSSSLSLLVWKTMCQADPAQLTAVYVPNQARQSQIKIKSSYLVEYLKARKWIPDQEGVFHFPADINQDSLHPGFLFDNRNGWLTAIGFGESSKKRSDEYKSKNEAAKGLGFTSAEEAEEIGKLLKDTGASIEDLRVYCDQCQRTSLPEASVPNPEKRRSGVLEHRDNAPDKESIRRERSLIPGTRKETEIARAYLRELYRNESDQLVCQCCHTEMPFKVKDDYYFEAVVCLKLEQRYYENRLALCPTCAAMYKHALETDESVICQAIVENPADDTAPSVDIPIRLAGNDRELHFVGKHWFDLKTLLSK